MHTAVINHPLDIIPALAEFKPDLILMDVYMPECTGLELARVIRQENAYLNIPIVFLSAEPDVDRRFAAMSTGADDFQSKPIKDEHLVSVVLSRARRFRALAKAVSRDSLTGVLKHAKFKERLAAEISRAGRQAVPLSFVLLDLDHFKNVNDRHGHLAGDEVLKSFCRMLQQRLRKMDIIGRLGGEEFGVILPNTDQQAALRLMEEIREDYAALVHYSGTLSFSITFSGGIAAFPEVGQLNDLIASADDALYQAKANGRNRIVLAGGPEEKPVTG
jgi:diguanylate cyclase (GGDEF)-like protein